jgi:hypothetical protein
MYLGNSGNVTVSNITIDNVTLIAVTTIEIIDLFGEQYERKRTRCNGGGIYRSGGGLSLANSVIKNITGEGNGCAGIYYDASANLEVSGLELQNITGYGIYSTGSGTRYFSGITAVTGIGGDYGIYSTPMTSGSFTVTGSNKFTSCGVYCFANGAVPIQVTDTVIRNNASGVTCLNVTTRNATITIGKITIDGSNGTGISASSENNIKVSNSTIKNIINAGYGGGIILNGGGTAEISNTVIENVGAERAGAIQFISENTTLLINNSQFINCTARNDNKIFLIVYRSSDVIIRDCTFTHDSNLTDMGAKTVDEDVTLFGQCNAIFENRTFNNLRGNMPYVQNYLFSRWGHLGNGVYSPSDLTLRNCTFNLNSGSSGLFALYSGEVTGQGYNPDYLLMDGVTINDNGGQRPLISLRGSGSTFRFKNNNVYNGTLLDTAAKISGLTGSSVLKLENGASPVLVP